MIKAEIKVFDQFPEITAEVDRLAQAGVRAAAEAGAKVAASIASERSASGEMANMEIVAAHGYEAGFQAGFRSRAWYAWFQDRGTLGRRRPKPKQPGHLRTHEPGTGIEPLRFFEKGRAAGRKALRQRIFHGL